MESPDRELRIAELKEEELDIVKAAEKSLNNGKDKKIYLIAYCEK